MHNAMHKAAHTPADFNSHEIAVDEALSLMQTYGGLRELGNFWIGDTGHYVEVNLVEHGDTTSALILVYAISSDDLVHHDTVVAATVGRRPVKAFRAMTLDAFRTLFVVMMIGGLADLRDFSV